MFNISVIRITFMENQSFILSFDLPRNENSMRVRIFRELKRSGAKMILHSFWKSDNLQDLMDIAMLIKKGNGKARILEEKFIF